jgi:hypothetical protein
MPESPEVSAPPRLDSGILLCGWLQRQDLNLRSPAYETGENVLASPLCYFAGTIPVITNASSCFARVITSNMVYISGINSL